MVHGWQRGPSDRENPNQAGYFGSKIEGRFAEYTKCDARYLAALESGSATANSRPSPAPTPPPGTQPCVSGIRSSQARRNPSLLAESACNRELV